MQPAHSHEEFDLVVERRWAAHWSASNTETASTGTIPDQSRADVTDVTDLVSRQPWGAGLY